MCSLRANAHLSRILRKSEARGTNTREYDSGRCIQFAKKANFNKKEPHAADDAKRPAAYRLNLRDLIAFYLVHKVKI